VRSHLFVTALLAMMIVPAFAGAVHGSAYTAHGLATLNGATYDAVVRWTGYWSPIGEPANSYVVTISDASTGDVVDYSGAFPGTWQAQCWCYAGSTEFFFPYHGWSSTQAVSFDLKGLQTINVPTASQFMLYVGNYEEYALVLIVDDYAG
jgi:hypothetical protein